MDITLSNIYGALKKNKYVIEDGDDKPYKLNLVAIRSNNKTPGKFDDWFAFFFKYKNQWYFDKMECTTDPGLFYLQHPLQSKGTAIIKEGQYIDSYQLGLHKGRYIALVQKKPITVLRDNDKDAELDFGTKKQETGFFGINVHAASLNPPLGESEYIKHIVKPADTLYSLSNYYKVSIEEIKRLNNLVDNTIIVGATLLIHNVSTGNTAINVGKWSAGCIVIANTAKYAKLIRVCQKASDIHGNVFSLTILNEDDL